MISVVCLWIKGDRNYGFEYVIKLRNMVARHLPVEHRFIVLTDRQGTLADGMEPIYIKNPAPLRPWWAKLQLFHPKRPFEGRMLYIDIDCLVVGDLTAAVEWPEPFVIAPDLNPSFTGAKRLKCVKAYNSSLMVWDAGEGQEFYLDFEASTAGRLWSDQDWMAEHRPDLPTFPRGWFRRSNEGPPPWPPETRLIHVNKPKPDRCLARGVNTWIKDFWC